MGLDSVELVMAFEEAFGVAIEDAEAAKMITPRDVILYIVQNRGIGTKTLCLTRRAFHRIRKRLMEVGIERVAIRLGAPLEQFFPEHSRRALWAQARGPISNSQWPELLRPVRLQKILVVVSWLLAGTVLVASLRATHASLGSRILGSLLLSMITAACASLLFLRLTQNQCRCFPGIATVHDLTICVAAGGAANLMWKDEEFTRDEIAASVKTIVIEQLGIKESDYAEDKEFVRDLGMD